jgi:Tol biopolymer transport system component
MFFLVATFFSIYNFAFRDAEKIKLGLENNDKKDIETKIETNRITLVSNKTPISPKIDHEEKKIVFYNKVNGNLENVSFDGSIENTILENNLEKISDVAWSPDKNFVILKIEKKGEQKFYLYSYITRKSIELKEGIDNVIWDNQGDKIIYKHFDQLNGERSINIADPNGKNWKKLVSLNDSFKKIELTQIPQSLFLSFWSYPDANKKTSLNKVNIIDGDFQEIEKDKFGADYLWSPDGRSFIVSSVDKKGSSLKLELSRLDNSTQKNLNMPTLVDKCVWSKDSRYLYCALPAKIPEDSVFPNDYQERKTLTKDTFWRIDTKENENDRIVDLEKLNKDYDATSLFLSPRENILFFINRYDDKLYKITLNNQI